MIAGWIQIARLPTCHYYHFKHHTVTSLYTSSVSKCAKMMMISVVFSIYKNIKGKSKVSDLVMKKDFLSYVFKRFIINKKSNEKTKCDESGKRQACVWINLLHLWQILVEHLILGWTNPYRYKSKTDRNGMKTSIHPH